MKRILFLFAAIVLYFAAAPAASAQGRITRPTKPKVETTEKTETEKSKADEAGKRQQAEIRRQREEEARRQQEAEEQRRQKAEAEAQRQHEAETARLKKEEVERQHQLEEEEARRKYEGSINGHDYVDLGLPSGLKWATCNVGAAKPENNGLYFSWGEIAPRSSFSTEKHITYGVKRSKLLSQNIIDSSGNLTVANDAVRANWGGSWRMPTYDEYYELKKNCQFTWVNEENIVGLRVTGPNGRSIFFPAAKRIFSDKLDCTYFWSGDYGCYWSGSAQDMRYKDGKTGSYSFSFADDGAFNLSLEDRYIGLTVRPVSK